MKIELIASSSPINLGSVYHRREESLLKFLNGVAEKGETPVILRGIFEESSAVILLGAGEKLPVRSTELIESFKMRTLRFTPVVCQDVAKTLRITSRSVFYSDDEGRIFTIIPMSKRHL